MKGGEIMRAIDILFNEINKINSEIKFEEVTFKKVLLALKIRKIVDIIEDMEELRLETHLLIDNIGSMRKDCF